MFLNTRIIRRILLASGLMVLIMVNSCNLNSKVDCPGFNEDVLSWLPYENKDTIRLINTSNDSVVSFAIDEIIVEHTTHYNSNMDCGTCDDQIMINTYNSVSEFQAQIFLNENIINNRSFLIKGVYFNESEFLEITDYTYNNKVYDTVWIFNKSGSYEQFIQLLVAKGYGIIGLVDLHYNNWVLLDNSTKSTKTTNVDIHNKACG